MRPIDADVLAKAKFHGYKEIEITPSDVNAESYKRGWNDAIDAIIESTPSVEREKGRWINHRNDNGHNIADCSECRSAIQWFDDDEKPKFCCMCGAEMENSDESD